MRLIKQLGLVAVTAASLGLSQLASANYLERGEVYQFADEMQREFGFNKSQLLGVLGKADRKQSIVRIMTPKKKSANSKTTYVPWSRYRDRFVNSTRINQGVEFYNQYRSALAKAEQKYGVPAEIITAIIGVETLYGRNMGSFRVLDALMTLSFDSPRRNEFFRKELKEFLLLSREQGFSPESLKGSYAGAMGYGQFMPSSYRKYAVDFDGDGITDIWNSPVDAIGSVANYFKAHGWVTNDIVVERAYTGKYYYPENANITREPNVSLGELKRLGFFLSANQKLPDSRMANLIELNGDHGKEYWLGFQNFFVITEYNHTRRYALSVYQLAQEIKSRHNNSDFYSVR